MTSGDSLRPRLLLPSAFCALLILAANLALMLLTGDPAYRLLIIDVTYPLWDLCAVAGLLYAAQRTRRSSPRLALAWGVLALGPLCIGIGNALWAVIELTQGEMPNPSLADAAYLAAYPIALCGVLLMPAHRLQRGAWLKVAFDMLIVMLAATLVSWFYILGPTAVAASEERLLSQVVALAYPVGDLVLLWALLVLLYRQAGAASTGPVLLLAVAFAAGIVADSIYARQVLAHTYTSAGLLDLSWVAIALLYGLAGVWQASVVEELPGSLPRSPSPRLGFWLVHLPYASALGAYLLLELSQAMTGTGGTVWQVVGVGALIVLVLLRQMISVQENRGQAQALQSEIAERRQAQAALYGIHERYRRAITAIDAVPYERDYRTESFVFIGEGIEQITGYRASEFTPALLDEITLENVMRGDAAGLSVEEAVRRTRQGELHRWQCDSRIRTRSGEERWVADASVEIFDEAGLPCGSIGILMDITGRKQAEEEIRRLEAKFLQAQKMEAVGKLAGGIAHDFNNLLTVINGYNELALRRLDNPEKLRRSLEEIKKAGASAAELTGRLLAFSRKQVLQPKILDLNSVVAGAETLVRRLVGEDIEVRFHLAPAPPQIKADPGQLEQVLMNLVVNARDAMPHGGCLTIETRQVHLSEEYARQQPDVAAGCYLLLAVSDTGVGMDQETQAHIFEPFFTTKGVGKGTGLGLSTVYGIVKQSGGHITVKSEVGQGATFHIYLPVLPGAAPAAPRRLDTEVALHGSETILLAEDEETVRKLACEVLSMYGYRVLEADTARCALTLCERLHEPIHLLLSDVVMPEMSGHVLASRLTALRPETRVLYMSGYTGDALGRHGVLEEGVNFIQKPFTPHALAHKVRTVLDGE